MEEEGSVISFLYDKGNACALHTEGERERVREVLSKNHLGFARRWFDKYLQAKFLFC